ncbi:TonB-dependent siderophore receptor [Niveibacterium terrae]|uniref:TonB-dependent siderophore receptor n=1 Tax=Niveibacterium terrae TaxID=3373598 RepID=UPI003A8F7475
MSTEQKSRQILMLLACLVSAAAQAQSTSDAQTETITVQGRKLQSGYQARNASVSGIEAPLLDTPASVSVLTRELLEDQQARLLSQALRNDASIGDSYAPVGYYENFVIRGFALDLASSYKINGRTITGEQNVALENKERVEVLKGLAGLASGIAAPAGLVNFVTKRSEEIRTVTAGTNDQGGRYLATDLGHWFDTDHRYGARINLAWEDIQSYVEHTDGKRKFASLAIDAKPSSQLDIEFDAEFQDKSQRSASGYQLLGGSTLPSDFSPRRLLGYQSWADPVTNRALNLGARAEYRFTENWKGALSASRSRTRIDDNVAFVYGCYYVASCSAGTPGNAFSRDGQFDVYDYRSPAEVRINDEVEARLAGRVETLGISHELSLGASGFRRTVDSGNPVYDYVGTSSLSEELSFSPSPTTPGTPYRRLDSRQNGIFATDRILFSPRWQALLGARETRIAEKAFASSGDTTRDTTQSVFLPQAALIFKPQANTSLYASWAKGLSQGGTAPWWANNGNEILAPTQTRQTEAGIKIEAGALSLSAALFQARQVYQYARPEADGSYSFVQQGWQKNRGFELSATGQVHPRLRISASAAAIRARAEDTGTAAYEGHQAINVPRLRASLYGDYAVPGFENLGLLAGLQASSSKTATRAGTVSVPGYAVFNVGARYATQIAGHRTLLHLAIDNVFDKRYWRDVGESAGDGYLFPGAPLTARLSGQFAF